MLARALVLAILLLVLVVPQGTALAAPGPPAALPRAASHAPILIEGNAALTASNGVTGGSGTPADPYIISGWTLNASSAIGLDVRNTTDFVVIRGLQVIGPGAPWAFAGIRLANVSHTAVENVTVRGTAVGVRLERSLDVTVEGSDLSGNQIGVSALAVQQGSLSGNTVRANGSAMQVGLDLVAFNASVVVNNEVALDMVGSGLHEIHLAGSSDVTLADNVLGSPAWIPSAGVGVWLDADTDVALWGNTFVDRGLSPTPFGGSAFHPFTLSLASFTSLSIPPNNTVNGRPILYCLGQPSRIYDGVDAGEIILADCDGAVVSNVTMSRGQVGIIVALSRSVTILGNAFDAVTLGVSTWASDVLVYHNNFNRSGAAQVSSGSGASSVAWDDGYPRGGNYWSDHSGVDNCSGPYQNVCPDPDGIRDSPQELGPGVYDEYPLQEPAEIANRWPVAVLGTDTVVADLLTPIRFDAVASYDPMGNASGLRMRWDFNGDGRWDTGWAPLASFSHYYTAPGFYHAYLEIQDSGGLLAITSRVVLVEYFHGWDIVVPILGAVALTLVANYVANRYLWRRRKRRVGKTWSGRPVPKEGEPAAPPPPAGGPEEPKGPDAH